VVNGCEYAVVQIFFRVPDSYDYFVLTWLRESTAQNWDGSSPNPANGYPFFGMTFTLSPLISLQQKHSLQKIEALAT
jgi:hypothetical protein